MVRGQQRRHRDLHGDRVVPPGRVPPRVRGKLPGPHPRHQDIPAHAQAVQGQSCPRGLASR